MSSEEINFVLSTEISTEKVETFDYLIYIHIEIGNEGVFFKIIGF